MELIALPVFSDNYVWMVHNGRDALVVDPGDAGPVLSALAAGALHLRGILVTHHHSDHVGGLSDLTQRHPQAVVYAPATEPMPVATCSVVGGDRVDLLGLAWDVIDVPGHTAGHIAYFHGSAPGADQAGETSTSGLSHPLLFCGDTLFSGGCGRLFEGTPSQMHASLSRLAALPAETSVCCAHEYTLANLKFALAVDPDNPTLIAYEARCRQLRACGIPTLPSTLAMERQINPFLRCDVPSIAASAKHRDAAACTPLEVFTAIRSWKNEYR
jgi:hydroxyacylglutathione hydrolase